MRTLIIAGLALACCVTAGEAQVPSILGTWKLNAAESRLPGPAPQTHVRRYSLAEDGTLVGLAVVVDAEGNPDFLQFAARSDGEDYSEFNSRFLAELQVDGTESPRTYSETPIDERTVAWSDKYEGRVIAHGRKWVSEDGRKLSFSVLSGTGADERIEYLYVFDRQ